MPEDLDQVSPGATEDEKIAGERLCGTLHNRSYVSGDIMWRR
jgi:hypothetical protein